MSEVLELNREEITRLSRMDDLDGHAWTLYLILKKNMDIYSGVVQVEHNVLLKVLLERLNMRIVDPNIIPLDYLENLINLLIQAEVMLDYLSTKNLLSVKLHIALSETCLEYSSQH